MEDRQKQAIEQFQCLGCVCGSDISCFEKSDNLACGRHVPGTRISGIGRIFLGMPKGFNRLGSFQDMEIHIFQNVTTGWGYDKLNRPVWKHLTKDGFVLVRGLSPRRNFPFLHIFLNEDISNKDMRDIDCLEIVQEDIDGMD